MIRKKCYLCLFDMFWFTVKWMIVNLMYSLVRLMFSAAVRIEYSCTDDWNQFMIIVRNVRCTLIQ